jgi:hypothetical protein
MQVIVDQTLALCLGQTGEFQAAFPADLFDAVTIASRETIKRVKSANESSERSSFRRWRQLIKSPKHLILVHVKLWHTRLRHVWLQRPDHSPLVGAFSLKGLMILWPTWLALQHAQISHYESREKASRALAQVICSPYSSGS